MNGAEHYREAEELLEYIAEGAAREGLPLSRDEQHTTAIRALAHVKLAEVALQAALAVHTAHMTSTARAEWREIGHGVQ